jgi:hypothetical protein
VGAGGTILRSTNSGATWTADTSGTTAELRGVTYAAGAWWAVGANGTVLKKTASTWSAVIAGDVTGPTMTSLTSSTHGTESAWYASSTATLNWAATDSSGVAGYSYLRDTSASTVPPTTNLGSAVTTTYAGLTSGIHYFHVRAVDTPGNWGGTMHRAIRVDVTNPAVAPTNPIQSTYADSASITLQATDSHSGVARIEWKINGGGVQQQTGSTKTLTFTPGTYTLEYRAVDVAGNAPAAFTSASFTVTGDPVSTVDLEHNAGGVTFDRWVEGYSGAYSGGGYVYSRWEGVALQARFKGTKVRWMGPKQPSYGKANVYIDGSFAGTVDQYSASGTLESLIFESATLTDTEHTLEIRLTGAKNPASTGYVVVLDYFEVEGPSPETPYTRTDERAGSFTGSWVYGANPTYFASGYTYSRWANATYRYTFTGTRIAWVGPKTGDYGRADIYIDGPSGRAVSTTVSQYGSMGWRTQVWESPVLPRATYTITVRIRGDKVAASSGNIIVLDAWDVRP